MYSVNFRVWEAKALSIKLAVFDLRKGKVSQTLINVSSSSVRRKSSAISNLLFISEKSSL